MSAYGYVAHGGRGGGSPYTSNIVDSYPRNLSGHFEYIDADQGILQDPHRPSVARLHSNLEDPEAPDVILIRYMASIIPVEFPPYSISEETAYVGQLRQSVANYLQTDPRRVRLVYKKRDLKHDKWPLRKYNMKQNSEVAAIKTESMLDYSDRDSHSSSGEDTESSVSNVRRRPRALSSVRHRSDEQLPRQSDYRPAADSAFLSPNDHAPSPITSERQSRSTFQPELDERYYRREPSRTRGTSPRPAPTSPPAPAPPQTPIFPPADPHSPLGKLQALSNTFHMQWLPLCKKFINSPPSDAATRAKEHRRLSESVMQHITLKADAIDLEGNGDARALRKGLINEVNEIMKRLDALARS
ncbi:uncharacterized protein A1O9_06588 [Exophiala aquamarina CBS 119918]|uniref:BAG domain-containing protein n=1 Tax=Exophiala aquamarina CBS 119918 TaxID=1182545 RepID=A0A072PFX3_9EURO|nr:uncharacterized protein A1O9_06588 [Exophiala aquamarina CBS 119918]KEF58662.1 hypothetical protein A1O9_06588 [Exophiala aquamarina CBS 119918]